MLTISEADADLIGDDEMAAYNARAQWLKSARSVRRSGKQIPPDDLDWEILLFLAGRGFGKTIAQVQWAWWEAWRVPNLVVHAVTPTLSDVRGTIFEGPAGFLATIPAECLLGGSQTTAYNKSLHELRLSNGSLIRGFGAVEEAGRLRGPQAHAMICDELREWDRPAGNLELAMSNALFGLRLPYPDGTPTRAVMGTTPKPIPYLKRFERRERLRVVRGTSYENMENLAGAYRTQLMSLAGTLMGRQEIDGAYIDEENDLSILKRRWINLFPAFNADGSPRRLPAFQFIIESYDTASSEEAFDVKHQKTDPSGCIVLGIFNVKDAFSEAEIKRFRVRSRYAALLLDCWTERLGLPELLDKARNQHRTKWGQSPGKRADIVLIEDKNSGPALRQFLAKWGVPCWPFNPGRQDKTMRAHAISPLVAQGLLFVPESGQPSRKGLPRDWCVPFLDEVCAFAGPGSTEHDEMVDVLTQAFSYLSARGMLEASPEEKYLDLEERIEADREEARRLHDDEKHREYENPYAV